MTTFNLFTVNYSRFRPEMGAPIQSSNGRPRFKLKYDLLHSAKETFPEWRTMRWPYDKFRAAYRDHLDEVGADVLASRFRALVAATGQDRLVLLCFEDLSKADQWCHRTLFAEWWKDRTGDDVVELGPTSGPRMGEEPLF